MIIKTSLGAICGGYTSQNWIEQYGFVEDNDAFVFTLSQKYTPNDHKKALKIYSDGLGFGDCILTVVEKSQYLLNSEN